MIELDRLRVDRDYWDSKAVEGATHFDPSAQDNKWYKQHEAGSYRWQPLQQEWVKVFHHPFNFFIPRPTHGELPQIGKECKYVPDPVHAPHTTATGIFLGRINGEDFIDCGDHVDRMEAIEPNRRFHTFTLKERTVDHWYNMITPNGIYIREIIEDLYDAGALKMPEER